MLCLVVYGSTGLFFCFFLPSGALLFTAGVLASTGGLPYDFFSISSLLIAASVAGSLTGYWFGRKTGPLLYRRKESGFFRRYHLVAAENFYKKYGGLAVTVGYFLPIIRSFTAVVAGMTRMNARRFTLLTITGSVLWVLSFAGAGYFTGSRPFLKPWLKYIIPVFILLVTIPLLTRIIKGIRKYRKENDTKKEDIKRNEVYAHR